MEGRSLTSILRGEQRPAHELVGWEHYGAKAIRQGNLKLVARKAAKWELYDLASDRVEVNNLAEQRQDKVRQLEAAWAAWARRTSVYPTPEQSAPAPDR
jgi:arylsulfatase